MNIFICKYIKKINFFNKNICKFNLLNKDSIKEDEGIVFDSSTKTYYNKDYYLSIQTNNESQEKIINSLKNTKKEKKNEISSNNLEKLKIFERPLNIEVSKEIKQIKQIKNIKNNNVNKLFESIDKKQLSYQELKKIDINQYIEIFKKINYNPEKSSIFNEILTIVRKTNKFKSLGNYSDVLNIFESISNNLNLLNEEQISEYSVNLSKYQCEKIELYKKIEILLIENAKKWSIRTISNILHSFIFISKKMSILNDFSTTFRELETIIAIKAKIKEIDAKSFTQIVIAYSKTQNSSNEFLVFLEKICIDMWNNLKISEIVNILHSFMKYKHLSLNLASNLKDLILQNSEKFKNKEIAMSLEILDHFNNFPIEIIPIIKNIIKHRFEQLNIQDFSKFYKFLVKYNGITKEDESELTKIFGEIYKNVDSNAFIDMCYNFNETIEKKLISKKFLIYWTRALKSLLKKNKLKGIYLTIVKKEINKLKECKLKNTLKSLIHNYI